MARLPGTVGAMALALSMILATSVGPAFGDEAPAPPQTTSETPPPPPETTIPPPPSEPEGTTTPALPDPTPADPTPTPADPTPSSAEPPPAAEEQADLRLTVAFDKASYDPADLVLLRATVVNSGTATATGVRLVSSGNLTPHHWRGFEDPYLALAPGESVQGEAAGYVTDLTDGVVRVTVEVQLAEPDAQPADNTVTVSAPLTVVRGGFTGTVYGDLNANQVQDPGEALAGLRVYTSGGAPHGFYETVADGAGRFAFHDLPAGSYTVYGDSPDWVFPGVVVQVDGTGEPEVAVRATTGSTAGSPARWRSAGRPTRRARWPGWSSRSPTAVGARSPG